MLEITLDHPMHCSSERFWEVFFDPAITRELIVGGLGFASCDVDPVVEKGGTKSRTMRVIPKLEIPAAVAKILGPKLGYTENGRLDCNTMRWSYEIVLSVLSERIKLGGRVHLLPDGDRCRRISELWCEVRILGVGGLMERAAEKNMRDGWNRSATWLNDWLDAHPAP